MPRKKATETVEQKETRSKAKAKAEVEVAEPYVAEEETKEDVPEIVGLDEEDDESIFKKAPRSEAIVRATRKEQRALYREDKKVFTINPDAKPKTPGEKLRETFLDLVAAHDTNTPREGEIVNVTRIEGSGVVVAVVDYNGYNVLIPASNLFVLSPSAVRDGKVNDAYHYYASLRIGARVKFNVIKVIEAEKKAYASRLAAMEAESRVYYVNQESNGQPLITAGMDVEATIVYITQTGIGVDIFGSEAFIRSSELTWLNVTYADRLNFDIGDVITVRILGVRPITVDVGNQTFHLIEVDASKKQAEDNPNADKDLYDTFKIGDKSQAVITYVDESGYYLNLANKRSAFASFSNDERRKATILPPGTTVSVKIDDKNDDGLKIYCVIRGIVKTAK